MALPQALFFCEKKVPNVGENFGPFLDKISDPFLLASFFYFCNHFIGQRPFFSAGGVAAGAFFFCEKKDPKFWRKCWTFFGQNFGPFFLASFWKKHSKCSETYLVRQISSRGSGSNFFIQN